MSKRRRRGRNPTGLGTLALVAGAVGAGVIGVKVWNARNAGNPGPFSGQIKTLASQASPAAPPVAYDPNSGQGNT